MLYGTVQKRYHISEIIRKQDSFNGNEVFQVLKSTHKIFEVRIEAEQWIFEEGTRGINYTVLEVFTKQ